MDDICSEYEEPDYLQMPDGFNDLMGPVNGVFCVVRLPGKMALFNPALRQFKSLSLPNSDFQPHLKYADVAFGFGVDPLSGNHKFVCIQFFGDEEMNFRDYPPRVHVYDSASDSWRHLEDLGPLDSSYCVYSSECNTHLNGVYYWLVGSDYADINSILAFDMAIDKFQEIRVPDCAKLKDGHLALYDDSIALLLFEFGMVDICIDVWVMKNEGCWTRTSTIGPFQEISRPLCFWKNNELLLETRTSSLMLYNVSTQQLRTVEVRQKVDASFPSWVFSYKESLVSIKGEWDNCKLWDTSSDFVKSFLR